MQAVLVTFALELLLLWRMQMCQKLRTAAHNVREWHRVNTCVLNSCCKLFNCAYRVMMTQFSSYPPHHHSFCMNKNYLIPSLSVLSQTFMNMRQSTLHTVSPDYLLCLSSLWLGGLSRWRGLASKFTGMKLSLTILFTYGNYNNIFNRITCLSLWTVR